MIATDSLFVPGATLVGFQIRGTRRRWKTLVFSALCAGIAGSLSAEQFEYGSFICDETEDGSAVIILDYPDDATGDVEIPETINSKPVVEIGYQAFADCVDVTSITIPSSVTTLPQYVP